MSYKEGVGIIKNAQMHVAQRYLLKMDFQNFFPSIKGDDIRNLIASNIEKPPFKNLSAKDIDVIVKIACRKNQLTIGAPRDYGKDSCGDAGPAQVK
jgi:RNA-directed DNA polymerase